LRDSCFRRARVRYRRGRKLIRAAITSVAR
jgi:hypothetical protein